MKLVYLKKKRKILLDLMHTKEKKKLYINLRYDFSTIKLECTI